MQAPSRLRRGHRGQATVEHLTRLVAVVLVGVGVGAALVDDLPGPVVGVLRDALGRRLPPVRDDTWALGSSTYRPLIRRYAPRLVLERDVWGDDTTVPVDPRRCRAAACARLAEASPTVFVHLKRLPGATYIGYWTYYPDSQTSHLPVEALRGRHRDDWEGVIVRLDADGAWARATAHGGFHGAGPWWSEASGWRRIGPHPVLYRAAGSHAGSFDPQDIDLAGDDWNGTLATIDPRRLQLEPADRLPAARLRYDAETTAPWRKRAWVDADVPGTSESGLRGRNAELAARWATARRLRPRRPRRRRRALARARGGRNGTSRGDVDRSRRGRPRPRRGMAIRTRTPVASPPGAPAPPRTGERPADAAGTADPRVFWPTFRRMLVFTRPYRVHLWASLVLAVLSQVAALSIPWLTGAAIDDAIRPRDQTALTLLIALIVAAGVIRLVLMVLRRLITGRMAVDIEQDLRNVLYDHLQRLSFSFYDTHQTGQLMSRATADLSAVRIFLSYGLLFFSQHAITIATVVLLLVFTDPVLAVVALATTPVLIGLAARYSRRSHPLVTDAQQKLADVTTQAEENVVGVRVVKAFGQEERETARFRTASERVFAANLRANRQRAIYIPLMTFVPSLAVAAVLLAGGYRVIEGDLTLGEFVRFNLLLAMMVGPLRMIGMWIGQAQRAISSAMRVFEVLDERPTVADRPDARPLPAGGGAIRMEGVTFGYDPSRPILDGIDLDIPAGSTVALIGPTGCGKTTLTTLIPRFYDVTAGRVLVDGVDVRDVTLDSLRGSIGIVSEETFLFSTTVRDNIAYGAPWATDEDVRRAAARAQAAEFIEALPDGYETTVGERGLTLSGGQRQRIAIARALLVDPRILILDDATASVDASTEAKIKRALTEVMEGRTTLIIAHRLSTISLADRIVVLDHGRVVADGDARQLLAESPVFREIHDHGLLERTFVDLDGDRVVARPEDHEDPPAATSRRATRLT